MNAHSNGKRTFDKRYTRILLVIILLLSVVFCTQTLYAKDTDSLISTNTDLVAPATNGLISILTEYVSTALIHIINNFTSQFDPINDYFYTASGLGSADNSFFDFFYYLGYFLTLTVFAFSIFIVALSGFFDNKNRAIELLVRLLVGCILIYLSRRILDIINNSFKTVWDKIAEPSEFESDLALGFNFSVFSGALVLVFLVLVIAFIIEFVKFILEIMERYIVVKLLYVASPAAMGMVVSRTTSSITVNYLRMYFSQLLLLLFNRFFIFLLCAMTATTIVQTGLDKDAITRWLFLIASCKAAQRVDSYMKSLGLTVAQTGSAVLDSIMGAVHTLGKGWGAAKGGAGFIGAAQMSHGAASGNYGLYKAGEAKQAFAKGGIAGAITPRSEAQTLSGFAKAGGVDAANKVGSKADKEALSRAMVNAYNNGDYGTLSGFDTATQTEAAKSILRAGGKNGEDAFRAATGFNSDDIQTAHFNSKGEIEGTIKTPGGTSTFKVSPESIAGGKGGNSGMIATTDGKYKHIQTKGNIAHTPEHGSYEHTKGGISNLSTMTGLDLDDDRLSELGASQYMIDRDDNTLYIADDEGNLVYARGLETGNEMWASVDKPLSEGAEQENQYSAEKANEDNEKKAATGKEDGESETSANEDKPLAAEEETPRGENRSEDDESGEAPTGDKPLEANAETNNTSDIPDEDPEIVPEEENEDDSEGPRTHTKTTVDKNGNRTTYETTTRSSRGQEQKKPSGDKPLNEQGNTSKSTGDENRKNSGPDNTKADSSSQHNKKAESKDQDNNTTKAENSSKGSYTTTSNVVEPNDKPLSERNENNAGNRSNSETAKATSETSKATDSRDRTLNTDTSSDKPLNQRESSKDGSGNTARENRNNTSADTSSSSTRTSTTTTTTATSTRTSSSASSTASSKASTSSDTPLNQRGSKTSSSSSSGSSYGANTGSSSSGARRTTNTTGKTTAANTSKKTYATPNVSVKDFNPGGKFEDYAPQGIARVERHADRNSVTFYTNSASAKDSGNMITVQGLRGTMKPDAENPRDRFNAPKLNLNDKNLRIIDDRQNGSYAVKSINIDTRKKNKV